MDAVRTTPLIGTKAWFGPRRLGWGLAPVSPEGWTVTAVATTASLVVRKKGGGLRARLLLAAVLLLVVILKGTAPGGPVARRAFEEARRAGGASRPNRIGPPATRAAAQAPAGRPQGRRVI